MPMSVPEELFLSPQFDGLAAVVREIVSELAASDAGLRKKLALAAGANIRALELKSEAFRGIMLRTAAVACGVPVGLLAGQ